MTTTVKMQQIKENANQCEMTLLEYVKEAMAAEGDQFAKWFLDDDTAELNAETENQILQAVGGVKTMQEILEAAEAKFRHAHVTTDGMAVIGEQSNWEEQITLIPNPKYVKDLGVDKPVKLQFQKMLGQARVYKHHKLRLWYVANGDSTGVWVNKPSDVDIFCRWN